VRLGKKFWVGEEVIRLRVKAGGAWEGFWVDEEVIWFRVKACGACKRVLCG
jgi:hypothetical protein